MLRPSAVLLVALVTIAAALPGSVAATSCLLPDDVYKGFLAGPYAGDPLEVPRNVAVMDAALRETAPLALVPLVDLALDGLSRPETPLAPNIAIATRTGHPSYDRMAITTDKIDTQPPTPVELLGVFTGGCGNSLTVDLEELPSDDQTPADELVYAVYTGSTAEEAEASPQPAGIWRGAYLTLAIYPRGEWVAVSVLDYAGNESPRSEATEVMTASTPTCAASRPSRDTSPAAVLALLLCAWASARTMRRRL